MFDPLDIAAYRIPKKESWPEGSYVRSKFGQNVLWLDRSDGGYHLSTEDLEKYRLLGDGPVDRILELLENDGRRLGAGDDLLLMAEDTLKTKSASQSIVEQEMASFLETHQRVPEWVDLDQIKRGQEVHLAYLPVVSLTLYYRSLIAGFSIPKIAEVIQATAYLAPPSRPDQALQRLLDTGEFVVACTALGVDALLPGGIGWKTALHVRFLHAKVRYAILKKKGTKRWNVDKFGIPINQEDMAATLLAFSTNVLIGIDLVSGVSVSRQERLDYLALWRYIGWLLGVETEFDNRCEGHPTMKELPPLDPCGPGVGAVPNPVEHSQAIFQSVIFHLLHPNESSVKIANHLLKVTDRRPLSTRLEKVPEEFYKNGLYYYRCFNCRRMIGDPLADALSLPLHPSRLVRINIYLLSTFSLTLMRIYSNAARWVAPVRRWIIRWHSNLSVTFHKKWMETHKTKMARALAKNEKSSVLDVEEEDAIDAGRRSVSLCPFAMTAKPE
eukprot:jgi/Psemu1/235232/estExt_Genewise1.C_260128